MDVRAIALKAREAASVLGTLSSAQKDLAIKLMAESIKDNSKSILQANFNDVSEAKQRGLPTPLVNRLALNQNKLDSIVNGLLSVANLPDPVGEVTGMWRRPNGLLIGKVRVPLGVICMIYEARPNVTADAAGLCVKTGNAVILRGGSEALKSNEAIVRAMQQGLRKAGLPEDSVQLITDPSRELAQQLMRLNGLIDVLIPRGGAQLIKTVVENATVPVIETGVGNCHTYVDRDADLDKACAIAVNAKVSNPAVCNAMETLLVDAPIAAKFLPLVSRAMRDNNVELRGCPRTAEIIPDVKPATEEDWYTEFLDLILAVKVVDGVDEAIAHINKYGTKHSEAIVTENYTTARKFLERVDAAAVYVNASTRFTDGYEYGFGAEIGISTQKLHARGPMGLAELTTTKYIILGDGQIRQ